MMKHIASLIKSGAITFLKKEYFYLSVFCVAFAILVYFAAEVNPYPYTTVAFLIGAITSMICGYFGMLIAVHTNWRTTYACNLSIDDGFHVAFKGGQVLGFALVGIALLILHILISVYARLFLPETYADNEEAIHLHRQLFECISGYGLGGSTVALFGRVGGGIYTKAADVGADLAGKVCEGLEEDSPRIQALLQTMSVTMSVTLQEWVLICSDHSPKQHAHASSFPLLVKIFLLLRTLFSTR